MAKEAFDSEVSVGEALLSLEALIQLFPSNVCIWQKQSRSSIMYLWIFTSVF